MRHEIELVIADMYGSFADMYGSFADMYGSLYVHIYICAKYRYISTYVLDIDIYILLQGYI